MGKKIWKGRNQNRINHILLPKEEKKKRKISKRKRKKNEIDKKMK
jgi:hypothetical protein